MRRHLIAGRVFGGVILSAILLLGGAGSVLSGLCGPFTDVTDPGFCPFVLEIFYLGITTGTTATTYDPASNVTRLQMAAFLSRTVDRTLQRGSRRAALDRYWIPQDLIVLGATTVGSGPLLPRSDGLDVWVPSFTSSTVSRIRTSDGRLLESWTGAGSAAGALIAMGKVLVTGKTSPGRLYQIDPTQPAGVVTTVASNLGNGSYGVAFDGLRVWVANVFGGSLSILTPTVVIPWTVTTVTVGFLDPVGVLFDGTGIWAAEPGPGTLHRLDSNGSILQTVTVGASVQFPVFDGANIWAPNSSGPSVAVVRASTGAILATLTGNGLDNPAAAAFDGQRILVSNYTGNSVSLWKAADFTPLGNFPAGPAPFGACSDGTDFWIALNQAAKLIRF